MAFVLRSWSVAASIVIAASGLSPADAGDRPGYRPLRYDEDNSFLADLARRTDAWDRIKYIPLTGDGSAWLSLSGEARERVEVYSNEFFRTDAASDSGYFLQRYLLGADLHAAPWLRVFGQLQSSVEDGRDVPRATDRDSIDVHQMFADVSVGTPEKGKWTLRVGRQEMAYGSERLISVREGTNNRRAFDAARVLYEAGDVHVDAFFARPVEVDPGEFNDGSDHDFWGVYATVPCPGLTGTRVDLYYLGLDNSDAVFSQGPGNEERHTLGARFFGERGAFDFNNEAIFQFGSYGSGDILAWSVALDGAYKVASWWSAPRFGLKAAIASGDRNPDDPDLQTLNPLFPRGNYFTEASLLGPQNFFDVHPCLRTQPFERVSFEMGGDFYWRESLEDGIYSPGGAVLYDGDTSRSRFVGTDLSAIVGWQATVHVGLFAAYTHFFAGAFIDDNDGEDTDYGAVWAIYRF